MLTQVESTVETPELLLRTLETELALRRQRRQHTGRHRAAIVTGGLVVVLAAAAVALMVLFTMLGDLSQRERPAGPPPSATTRL